jgi:hypothetical protein
MYELLQIIGSSLSLNEEPWRRLLADPNGLALTTALVVVTLAGLSEALAQSIVLVLNKVKPRRFFASLGLNALVFTGSFIFYVLSIAISTRVFFGIVQPPPLLIKSVALAYAPLIFSFVTLIPYFGRALSVLLTLYHFLAIVVAVRVVHDLSDGQALAASLLGLLLFELLQVTLGRPLVQLVRWLKYRTAGVSLKPAADLLPRYRDEDER